MSARYDRQLRIWGAHGQRRLETARVCVLGAGPCGSEALKNLVLGGIGAYTLVDDAVVSDEDFGRNYLVDTIGMGQPLAQVVYRLLTELNEAAHGSVVQDAPTDVIATRPDFFKDFSLVIANQLSKEPLQKLIEVCSSYGIPLMAVQSYGLVGSMKVYYGEACVVESKPDDEVPDLRLGHPWGALMEFVHSFDLDRLGDVEHCHVPYVVILLKAAEKWRETSPTAIPSTGDEKRHFRSLIQQMRRTEKKTDIEEENFEEAYRAAYQFWMPYSIPNAIKEIFQDDCIAVTKLSPDFWIVAAAMKRFYDVTGALPLNGSIPDMTATTESYLKLQSIYSSKATEDVQQVGTYVREMLARIERPEDSIPSEMITLMCRNARNLRMVRSQPDFLSDDPDLLSYLRNPESFRNVSLALLLEAVDAFYQSYARHPGSKPGEDWTKDVHLLVQTCHSIANLTSLEQELQSEIQSLALEVWFLTLLQYLRDCHITQICRCGGGELHNVSAVMGGIAAQEAIKLLTHQFVPFRGTLLYNAMDSTTTRF